MTPGELQEILRRHGMWLRGEVGGARANLREADLCDVDLSGEDLRGADISGADLRGADFRKADLRKANLSKTNLSEADLREADLRDSDLRGADISDADFRGAINGAVCRMDFGGWSICIRASHTSIGCQQHENEAWLAWPPGHVAHMHPDARDWWADHGDAIKAVIRCVMSKAAKEKEIA